jgi:aminoglycoside phosphotransferase family enzyme/predicted kinase
MTSAATDEGCMQENVFAFLGDPKVHPDTQRIDTHAASVFLQGDRALKIKRAVRFPFLDYSTLVKRKSACDEELRINQPFAPQIYRRVVPITRDPDGELRIGGQGPPVEYAVEMARFDERRTIDHLAQSGPLDSALVEAIADAIAASHEVASRVSERPWISSIPGLIEGYIRAFREAACFSSDEVDDLATTSQAAFSRLRGVLERRGARGYLRRCHGDLHLANIVLIEDKPVLFDAIEFDETIASTDVLYDLAFPLMDLLHYGQQAAANGLLNRYLGMTSVDHLDALALLPLFLSMRSAIRAHVLLMRQTVGNTAAGKAAIGKAAVDNAANIDDARAYFGLARALLHPPAPVLVAVGGLSGTGKSVVARALAPFVAPQPGAVVLRSDVLRKQLFGVGETERLQADGYRPEVTERVYDELRRRTETVLSQGHSVVVDAVSARETERAAIREAARRAKVAFAGIFLAADLATRQRRVRGRTADASDATPEVARLQESYNIGPIDWAVIDASGTHAATLKRCQTHLIQMKTAAAV